MISICRSLLRGTGNTSLRVPTVKEKVTEEVQKRDSSKKRNS